MEAVQDCAFRSGIVIKRETETEKKKKERALIHLRNERGNSVDRMKKMLERRQTTSKRSALELVKYGTFCRPEIGGTEGLAPTLMIVTRPRNNVPSTHTVLSSIK